MVRWTPRQLMAVGLGLPFALLRPALYGIEHGALPFAFTWIGVLVAAWVGGLWPTLVVSLAGLAVGNHILVEAGKAPLGPGGVLFYTLFMLVLAVPAELYHRISRRRRADQQLLADMGQRLQRAARLNAMGELAGTLAHIGQGDGGGRAGDAGHVVVLGQPIALKAQPFCGVRELAAGAQRLAGAAALHDGRKIEDRERDHGRHIGRPPPPRLPRARFARGG
jgi:hypothetical protein